MKNINYSGESSCYCYNICSIIKIFCFVCLFYYLFIILFIFIFIFIFVFILMFISSFIFLSFLFLPCFRPEKTDFVRMAGMFDAIIIPFSSVGIAESVNIFFDKEGKVGWSCFFACLFICLFVVYLFIFPFFYFLFFYLLICVFSCILIRSFIVIYLFSHKYAIILCVYFYFFFLLHDIIVCHYRIF